MKVDFTKKEVISNIFKNPEIKPAGILNTEKKDQEPSSLTDPEIKFLKWWKFYNRREGNIEQVKELFKTNIKTDLEFSDLVKSTRNYNECSKSYPIDKVKYPVNFLKCYKDFIKIDN